MATVEKQEPVFDLIKSMSKAEKRNFKLYATRLAGNQQSKFLTLFDHLDGVEEYDEARILQRCPIKKEQLPNMKAHLYKQILVSLRLLNVQHSESMQLREQFDFARILYDKGLYRQSDKLLEKTRERALEIEEYTIALDVLDFQTRIAMLNVTADTPVASDASNRRVQELCSRIETISEFSNTTVRVYSLYQKLGYARTQKDLDLIVQYFKPRLEGYAGRKMSFLEQFYYYQASVWYYYIQHDFARCYRHSRLWVALFDAHPRMKVLMYDNYMKGCSRILEGLFIMQRYRPFVEYLDRFEQEFDSLARQNNNAFILSHRILYTARIHKCFFEGTFKEGTWLIREVESFIGRYSKHLDIHYKMLMNYKFACLYFGDGNYLKCMEYLARIIGTKDPHVRRDLQCYARMLNLIASYEAGVDYNLDYQIRSVYSFLVKMNDMHEVQREMLSFLKRLNTIYADHLKDELKILYERLKPYETHPYERRTFYYLDVLSWLESKITGKSVGEIIRRKFRESTSGKRL